jgi:ParB family chromosome partitioning protein
VDREFMASVRDLGVLVPIVAVRTVDCGIRVRFGHRRTQAAIAAGLTSVPVVVVAEEATSTAGQVDRLVTQYAENEHRTGLTLTEQVGVVGQLAAFGVSAAQIAKRTKLTRVRVDAALTVAGSEVARAAAADGDLDLTEAAIVAEFESDPAAVEQLVDAAGTGRFDHVAQRLRDDRVRAQRREAFTTALTARGVTVVAAESGVLLRDLTDQAGAAVTVDGHTGCPGHAARVTRAWGRIDRVTGLPATTSRDTDGGGDGDEVIDLDDHDGDDTDTDDAEDDGPVDDGTVWGEHPAVVWVCTDPDRYGHLRRPTVPSRGAGRVTLAEMTPAQADAARADRRDVLESNSGWRSAVTVRLGWLGVLLTRRTPPKGTAVFVATALACDAETVTRVGGHQLAADLLGCAPFTGYGRNPAVAGLVGEASDARAQVLTLALVLAGYEDATHTGSWRQVNQGTARYLTFLAACGYGPADVERRACGLDPAPAGPDPDSED